MSILKIWQNSRMFQTEFEGTPLLHQVLTDAGLSVAHPCGGRGLCGKCAVKVSGQVSAPNDAEIQAGMRLSCQCVLLGDAQVWLPEKTDAQIETSGTPYKAVNPMSGQYGCAIDIGTTTLALKLVDLSTGEVLSVQSRLNPQQAIAADVMGRIAAAMDGKGLQMQALLLDALAQMRQDACVSAQIAPEEVLCAVITGNTTMLYLLLGKDTSCLHAAPFSADCLFGVEDTLLGMQVFFPSCMHAFVGADITCALLASGMCSQQETALLCDIGTNGELALWKDGTLYVASTAAGPAFEGAGISCGCGCVRGAIDRVELRHGAVVSHTVGDAPATGICGSGLIDAIAVFLATQDIDETGATAGDFLPLTEGIRLLPKDVRAIQLAKAAIRAGIQTILEMAQATESEIQRLYIAGGFGSHLNVTSAAAIGLIPPVLQNRVKVMGNGALTGAMQMLLNREQAGRKLANGAKHLDFGGNPIFNRNFVEQILFDNACLP